ncbi:MAG TPA: biliverdin-producing heme oxygenase, partial [Gemmatirosa sp.]
QVSPTPPPLRTALRAGTRDLHDRTEAAFVLAADDLTRAEYAAVLARLLTLHSSAEGALDPWTGALAAYGVDLAARTRSPLLRRDLAALAPDDPPGRPPAAGITAPTPAHALGILYVLEGSTLGGQLLRRRIEARLGLTPATGLAFLTAYGTDVGAMWRAFSEALDRCDAALDPAARATTHAHAVAGARAAFLAFEREVVAPTARRPVAA